TKSAETGSATAVCKIGTGTPKLITGHIDILQIRNGQIHILDYKPNAGKERPIEQLTLYAMALSRLTGLRLFEFKCAWFDENDYFEFFPLHVLHKPRKGRRRRKVYTMEGVYKINQEDKKISSLRPINKTNYVIH
ncbi:PD-(D/E)XK nuclease family protein, partial [Microgenomates group bacterium]|nr:PD-(D/E)XK nuclease family protein [Microgenomates group bacterium]